MGEQVFDTGAMGRVVDLTAVATRVGLDRLGEIAELDSDGSYLADGYTSVSAFLVHRCGMGAGEANRHVFMARSLQHLPLAVKLVDEGRLSLGQLEALAHARARHPDEYAQAEAGLCEVIEGVRLADTRRAVDYWCRAFDEPDDPTTDPEPSKVFLSELMDGRGRLDGDLDADTYQALKTALDALMAETVRDTPKADLAPAPQRRGEALGELARRYLDSPDPAADHGNRPHVAVVIDWETLTGARPGGIAEYLDGPLISAETAKRLACDANVCRVLTGPNSEILDLGRTKRTVTPAQWKALRLRDRHCQFPGCYRPPSWCDAHHIEHWTAQDGPTDLHNLCLLCRFHHGLVHEGGWTLTGTPGHLTFTRPNGTPLAHAPP